ncbi:hypothetical protein D0Y65_024829 [Glycine soja]|uniref:Uncharacterized protein n=1 Tax=Glycine soja TaxID=3848 RepID=A0A445J420_GLYSO|nr:hypothetical protein D0Y65_024829 [Glycine soja]
MVSVYRIPLSSNRVLVQNASVYFCVFTINITAEITLIICFNSCGPAIAVVLNSG